MVDYSTSVTDNETGTDSSQLSVRFDVSHGSNADMPHKHPPSPPPPSVSDPNSSPSVRPKGSSLSPTVSPIGWRATSSPKNVRNLFHSPHLRSNLTREQRDRDPLFFYEIVKTLGVGSMGSVAKVKKRDSVVGGSARKDLQDAVRRQKRHKECLNIPLIGGLFRLCIDGNLKQSRSKPRVRKQSHDGSSGRSFTSWFGQKEDAFTMSIDSVPSALSLSRNNSMNSVGSNGSLTTGNGYGIQYAMKSIHLNRVTDKKFLTELRNEIEILKRLDHPHIVRAMETFEYRHQIFIVMELCSGGDLYSRDPYTEEEAARIASSILSAIAYMHSRNILHRDLKYENVLFVNDSPKSEIKLIDFGLSKIYGDNTELTEGVGTIYTMAPEVLKGNYTSKADVWSVGRSLTFCATVETWISKSHCDYFFQVLSRTCFCRRRCPFMAGRGAIS